MSSIEIVNQNKNTIADKDRFRFLMVSTGRAVLVKLRIESFFFTILVVYQFLRFRRVDQVDKRLTHIAVIVHQIITVNSCVVRIADRISQYFLYSLLTLKHYSVAVL